ncbi:hypothetical protein R80B4_03224 [Fibrobacteres bacterium R8-0-B4]
MKKESWLDEEDPIEEVYRIRREIMEEFDHDLSKYHAYVVSQRPVHEAMGFKYVTEVK